MNGDLWMAFLRMMASQAQCGFTEPGWARSYWKFGTFHNTSVGLAMETLAPTNTKRTRVRFTLSLHDKYKPSVYIEWTTNSGALWRECIRDNAELLAQDWR
jgi:hypothetical protein